MIEWLRRRLRPATSPPPPEAAPRAAGWDTHDTGNLDAGALWAVVPPEGVRLVSSSPSKTGQGGRGVIARYSDGTAVSAMLNSDGSICVLFFRGGQGIPAVLAGHGPVPCFTWNI